MLEKRQRSTTLRQSMQINEAQPRHTIVITDMAPRQEIENDDDLTEDIIAEDEEDLDGQFCLRTVGPPYERVVVTKLLLMTLGLVKSTPKVCIF